MTSAFRAPGARARLRPMAAAAALLALALSGCANVKPFEREKLADPIMNLDDGMDKLSLERKVFSTREAAIGGSAGVAGGCGCAK